MLPTIELLDLQGAFWRLKFAATQINKRDGMSYVLWYVDEDCPVFLRTNGAKYEVIATPLFTEWF